MKYVCFEMNGGVRIPILFPDMVNHSDIARSFTEKFPGYKAVSAGYASNKGNVYGHSLTLGLKPDAEDSLAIKRLLEVDE